MLHWLHIIKKMNQIHCSKVNQKIIIFLNLNCFTRVYSRINAQPYVSDFEPFDLEAYCNQREVQNTARNTNS